jgi:hypothetical protein
MSRIYYFLHANLTFMLLGLTLAQQGTSPVQFRINWPVSEGGIASAFNLSSRSEWEFAPWRLVLELSELGLPRQEARLGLQGPALDTEATFIREPSFSSDSRYLAYGLALVYTTEPAPFNLNQVSARITGEVDTDIDGYRRLDADIGLAGALEGSWTWRAGYGLAWREELAVSAKTVQALSAQLATPLTEQMKLAVIANAKIDNSPLFVEGGPELTYDWELESLAGRVFVNTDPGYEVLGRFNTCRLDPVHLGFSLGRGNRSPLIWGGSVGIQNDAFRFGLAYENRLEVSQTVLATLQDPGSLALEVTWKNTPENGVWQQSLSGEVRAQYTADALTFNLRGQLSGAGERIGGYFKSDLVWLAYPFALQSGGHIRYRKGWLGEAAAEGLYFLREDLALSIAIRYLWRPEGNTPGLSIGFKTQL